MHAILTFGSLGGLIVIIGLYYFKEVEKLRDEIKFLIDNKITGNGEYQITDALENLKKNGLRIKVAEVEGWFDCGNKDATVLTNQEILKLNSDKDLVSNKSEILDSVILKPCFIDNNVKITNSLIGPYVSVGKGTTIENSIVSNSIILNESKIINANLDNSMIGNNVKVSGTKRDLNLGDFSEWY